MNERARVLPPIVADDLPPDVVEAVAQSLARAIVASIRADAANEHATDKREEMNFGKVSPRELFPRGDV